MRKTSALLIMALSIIALSGCSHKTTTAKVDETALKQKVAATVNAALAEDYQGTENPGRDNKVDITQINASQNAVEGLWRAGDPRDRIAYRQKDGTRKILLSMDGFDCDELHELPDEHIDFFTGVMHPLGGRTYCH